MKTVNVKMSLSIRNRVRKLLRYRFSCIESEIDDGTIRNERVLNSDKENLDLKQIWSTFIESPNGVESSPSSSESANCMAFISHKRKPEIYYGKTGLDLPNINLQEPSSKVCACFTGPDGGLTKVQQVRQQPIIKMANLDDELTLSIEDENTSSSVTQTATMQNESLNKTEESGNAIRVNNISFVAISPNPKEIKKDVLGTNKQKQFTNEEPQYKDKHLELPKTSSLFSTSSLETLGFAQSDLIPGSSTDDYNWNTWDEERAYGLSTSLYEKHPVTGITAGTPNADVFGIIARENNCILALADGVNWGEGARLAARCAIRGALDHMNGAIENLEMNTTTEVFHRLLGAFHAAHALILQEGGALTTLCVAFVARVRNSECSALCVCNVGDSLCFIYNSLFGVREVTLGSHDIGQMRDMRNAGGALGPVDGRNPQLHNLTCSMTFVDDGDIVFITSDGISDNFDPVVGKFCVIKSAEQKENVVNDFGNSAVFCTSAERYLLQQIPLRTTKVINTFHKTKSEPLNTTNKIQSAKPGENAANKISIACQRPTVASLLPCVDALERHELMLMRMADVISKDKSTAINKLPMRKHFPSNHQKEEEPSSIYIDGLSESSQKRDNSFLSTSAFSLCKNLTQFAYHLSAAKRHTLEDPELYRTRTHSQTEERLRRKMIRNMISGMPGKLDHASVVAYRVGYFMPDNADLCNKYGEHKSSPPESYRESIIQTHFDIAEPHISRYNSITNTDENGSSDIQCVRNHINCNINFCRTPEREDTTKTLEGEVPNSSRSRLILDIPPELETEYQISFSPTSSARRSPYEEQSGIKDTRLKEIFCGTSHSTCYTKVELNTAANSSLRFDRNTIYNQLDRDVERKREQNENEIPKRRRHLRNSLARHTLAVDISWLKRLVLSNHTKE